MLTVVKEPKPQTRALLGMVGRRFAVEQKLKGGRVSSSTENENLKWVRCVEKICANGDTDAFATLFKEFAPRIKGFLINSGASNGLAEECVQDTMATVWHKSRLFDPSRATVSTWIFTIARNKRIDAVRKQNRPEPEDLFWGPVAEPDAEDVIALGQETERLTGAIKKLPAKQRDLISRAFFGELTHQEIADETGIPMGTIKSRIRLALEKLRHEMTRV